MWKNPLPVFLVVLLLAVGNALGQAGKAEPAGLDADPHLVGWWKLDDAAGKTATDSSKGGHDGVLEGGLSFEKDSVAGRKGKAVKLDGRGVVEIKGYKGIAGTKPRTVAAWIKTKSSRGEIVAWGTDDFGKMFIFGFIRGRVGVTPSGGYLYISDPSNDDKWHHVVAVVHKGDPPNLHDHVKLYVDGRPAAIHKIGLLDLWPVDTGSEVDVRIGRGFNGQIDDVRIYDRALSVEEVNALFKQK